MTLQRPHFPVVIRSIRSKVLSLIAPPAVRHAPKVGDAVQTRWGWWGEIVTITDKGYTLHMLWMTQDGKFIKVGGNPKQWRRWVWFSEVAR